MNKKLQLLVLLVIFTLPIFLYSFTYLSDADYKKLSGKERTQYLDALNAEITRLQNQKADAIAQSEQLTIQNDELRAKIANMRSDLDRLYDELGITESDINAIREKIKWYQDQLTNNWERMSDDELWRNAKQFVELREDYNKTRADRLAGLPEFQKDFTDLTRRFNIIAENIDRLRKTTGYYEDSYTVKRGEYLSKISGYDFIYGDPKKWGIIYRANRDQIKNPNLIYPNQNLKIPRGQPTSWKVYRGESLWKISQYPEVYGTGKKWPTIYRANKDQIKDPNLIYPNQVFSIPRD